MNDLIARLAPVERKFVWDLFDGARVVITVVFARSTSKESRWEAEIRRRVSGKASAGSFQGEGHSKDAALSDAFTLYAASVDDKHPPIEWVRVTDALGKAGAL